MARSSRTQPEKQNHQILWLERAIRERRGTGTGATYIPWIQVRRFDLNSRGRSHVFPNPLISPGRQHHVLSDLELKVLILLMWSGALDIREQYPLRLKDSEEEYFGHDELPKGTCQIADDFGIKHPSINLSTPRVMTTDFLVTHRDGSYCAIYVKYSNELESGRNKRLGQLLEIAREYWRQRNVRLIEVTECDVCSDAIRWCVWAQDSLFDIFPQEIRSTFVEHIVKTDSYDCMTLRLDHTARLTGLTRNEVRVLLKQTTFLRELSVDFRKQIDLSKRWNIKSGTPHDPLPSWHFLSPTRSDKFAISNAKESIC